MPIGLVFYNVGNKRFAFEASRLVSISEHDNGNATITLDSNAVIHTDTPYQQIIDDYTYRVAVSSPVQPESVLA